MANSTKSSKIQDAMFQEIQDHQLFKSAQSYAFQYLNEVFDRNVYPTEEALNMLQHFEEDMPNSSGNVQEILDSLHHYGSPATLPTLGGRYFGFVTGSCDPCYFGCEKLERFLGSKLRDGGFVAHFCQARNSGRKLVVRTAGFAPTYCRRFCQWFFDGHLLWTGGSSLATFSKKRLGYQ